MKVLLTGANGQLARALIDLFQKRPIDSVSAFSHAKLDIADKSAVDRAMAEVKPDVVINAAAYNYVEEAESDPASAFAGNETGPKNLAVAAVARKATLVHVSTDYVFDGTLDRAYLESDATNPLSVYAKSKLAGEKAVMAAHPKSYVVRTAWVFHMGGRNFLLGILANKDKPSLSIVNDQFGSPTYAPHLAEKILYLLDTKAAPGVYHMAGQGKASRYDFAKVFFQQMGVATPLKPIPAAEFPTRVTRPKHTPLDTERGAAFRLPAWEQGVSEFVRELKNGMRTAKI